MKQKQTKNKHSCSARARSDQCTMDMQNRSKSTLEGKISRIETFIESANEETDSVEIKVKLRSLIQLQKNVEELRNNYYAIPNVKDAELTAVDEDLHLLEVRLESLERRFGHDSELYQQYREIIRDYTEQDRNFYVDDLISVGNEFEEALQTSRRAKNIMEAAGRDLRKWITNDANLMEQWKKENFNVHPVHETVILGANGTKVLGLSWNTNEDYLTTDT
ncbi:uncharacterized protein TNCV_1356711 [Trichonephila clavipes]|uniref:Uncharacterized protein n=1 Tax=Trichonephila clavipes TaxID=2585209 RepID=A0A8X6S7I3_TRICX|nr:uncharacterized protein TNCV_1356711 [Trichonephila clavipes]